PHLNTLSLHDALPIYHTFSETGEISFDRLGETHTFFLSKQTETHLLNNFYIEPQIISEKNYFASDLEKYPDAEYLENRQLKNEEDRKSTRLNSSHVSI